MGIRGLVHSSRTRLFLILVVGLILRVGYARSLGPEPRFGDAADYLVCSDNLVHGAGFRLEPVTTKRGHLGPVYPLFLAGLRLAGVDRVEMFRLVQAIIGSCLPLLLFFLGRRLFDTVTALWAALFAALYPYMIHWSGTISSEWIGILLLVLGLWMLTAAESRPGPVLFLAAGGAIGLAALARPPLYPLCLLFTGLVLIGNWPRKRWQWKSAVWFFLGVLVMMGPWSFRNYMVFHRWIPVALGTGTAVFQQGLHTQPLSQQEKREILRDWFERYYDQPATPEREFSGQQILSAQGMEWIRQRPLSYMQRVWYNFRRFWSFYPTQMSEKPDTHYRWVGLGSYGLLFPLMLWGFLRCLRDFRRYWYLFVPVLFLTVAHSMLFGMIRYRMPIEPILLLFAAMGMSSLIQNAVPNLRNFMASAGRDA